MSARLPAAVLLLGSVGGSSLACSTDESAEPGGAPSPPASSSAPTPESSKSPTEEPTEALGGPTLDQEGVLMTLPAEFPPDEVNSPGQKTSSAPDGRYAGIDTLLPVGETTREELMETILANTEIERPATVEDDVEIDSVTFVHLSGRSSVLSQFRSHLYRGATPELLIGIRLTTPVSWSEEQREEYLQPILDSVVIP